MVDFKEYKSDKDDNIEKDIVNVKGKAYVWNWYLRRQKEKPVTASVIHIPGPSLKA